MLPHCPGNRKQSDGPEEFIDLLNEKDDTAEPSLSFIQALGFFCNRRMVLITGVQGSGKTFLARLLVNDLKKNECKREMFWISNLTELRELQTKSIKEMNIYVFDGVFYELQTDKKLREAVKDFEFF